MGRAAVGGPWQAPPAPQAAPAVRRFEVAKEFRGVSGTTIAWTQQIVDAALSYPDVTARRHDCGIEFSPNFIWIERLYTRFGGVLVSFYGEPSRFRKAGVPVKPGRSAYYSRISVRSSETLQDALKALMLARGWKR